MPKIRSWGWDKFVLVLTIGAYVPLLVGGWKHPSDMNVACFGLWIILSFTLTWSGRAQNFSGWKMQLGFLVGNVLVTVFALIYGGYTFNIGPSETTVLYGFGGLTSIWVIVGYVTKRWSPRMLYLGTIMVDVASFYPQFKQYLGPHEHATLWMRVGWLMFGLCTFLNGVYVERLLHKLHMNSVHYAIAYGKKKNCLLILEESAFSIENFTLISITVILMSR